MFKKSKKEKPVSYDMIIEHYGSRVIISQKELGPIPEGTSFDSLWSTCLTDILGKNMIELGSKVEANLSGSHYIIEMSFVTHGSSYRERVSKPILNVELGGFSRSDSKEANIINKIKSLFSSSTSVGDLIVVQDVSGGYWINKAARKLIDDLDKEHLPRHLRLDTSQKDNYFVVGDCCFNAKHCKNYYEYMEALIGPRPWMVE